MLKELKFIEFFPTHTNHEDGLEKAWKEFKELECYNSNSTYVSMFDYNNGDMVWQFFEVVNNTTSKVLRGVRIY